MHKPAFFANTFAFAFKKDKKLMEKRHKDLSNAEF
jgi:hypothetical protein